MKKIFQSYLGGKEGAGTYQTIINHIPPHKVYIEGYLGNGAILRNKKAAAVNVGIDYNENIIRSWKENFNFNNNFEYIHADFYAYVSILNSFEYDNKDTFIYLDPPYLHTTRTSSHRYTNEISSMDHELLLQEIVKLNCNVMISCYDNSLYKSYLDKWNKHNFVSQTRGGQRTETIYYNYEISELHEYTYLGKDFTDRQRIKRKIDRWINKLSNLDTLEQMAILHSLKNKKSCQAS